MPRLTHQYNQSTRLPLSAGNAPTGALDPYIWRASYLPVLNVDSQFVQDPSQDFGMLRWGLREWKRISPFLLKDLYVLTPWHARDDVYGFTAYAFYDPDTASGALLAFRQEKCAEDTLRVFLPFAGDGGPFTLTDEDTGEALSADGAGPQSVCLRFDHPRQARLLWLRGEAS